MPLLYENVAEIGDTIKAFDFRPMNNPAYPDRFVIGKVLAKGMTAGGYKAFTIAVTEETGNGNKIGDTVYVPMQTAFMEYDGRVTKVEAV